MWDIAGLETIQVKFQLEHTITGYVLPIGIHTYNIHTKFAKAIFSV